MSSSTLFSSTQNNIYRVINALFEAPVGISATEASGTGLPIVGTLYDLAASQRFTVYFTHDNRVTFFIDEYPVVVSRDHTLRASTNSSEKIAEFTVEFVSEQNFRRLYKIASVDVPGTVWTLNFSAAEPGNKASPYFS
ncbi:hypothetical protein D9756_011084 [Leucocoprinus leucothites]|uniref:Uncharacterized protein n=1 Tax=Leucocoprinus leucothites TaxID=201217 RepID=A0A8H5FQ79_9AGAR|nr:hypothetical protein D9756_011084 [Leucoagaricus leucothites]